MKSFSGSLARLAASLLAVLASAGSPVAEARVAWTTTPLSSGYTLHAGGPEASVLLATRYDHDPVRSEDGGRTWSEFSVLGRRPETFVASPSDPLTFFALSGGYLNGDPRTPPASAYRTHDGGRTWELLAEAFQAPGAPALGGLQPGAHRDLVYATRMEPATCFTDYCSHAGTRAFVSRDGGLSWRDIHAGLGDVYRISLFPSASDERVVYALTSAGLHRSDDQGATWKLVRAERGIDGREVVVDRVDPDTVYLSRSSSANSSSATQLWITRDGGSTWDASESLDVGTIARVLLADPVQAGRIYAMTGSGELFESRDRARTWRRVAPSSGEHLLATRSLPVMGADSERRFVAALPPGSFKRLDLAEDAIIVGSDLWWDPAESGTGFTITQHPSEQMFVVWYGYDAAGLPTWRVMPGGTWQDGRTFSGELYATRGPGYTEDSFDRNRVSVLAAGNAMLRFEGESRATFSWRLADGSQGERRIERQVFGPLDERTLENYADLWWAPTESGWGIVVNHQFAKVFATLFVYESNGTPVWFVMPDMDHSSTVVDGSARATYSGLIYAMRGPRSTEPYDPARVVATSVGAASLVFLASDEAQLTYTIAGRTISRRIARQPF